MWHFRRASTLQPLPADLSTLVGKMLPCELHQGRSLAVASSLMASCLRGPVTVLATEGDETFDADADTEQVLLQAIGALEQAKEALLDRARLG
jgi:hypothetical protein